MHVSFTCNDGSCKTYVFGKLIHGNSKEPRNIFIMEDEKTNEKYCMKVIHISRKTKKQIDNLYEIQTKIDKSPAQHLIKSIHMKKDDCNFYVLYPYLGDNALIDLYLKDNSYGYRYAKNILIDICNALLELEALGYYHNDVKSDNILLCEKTKKFILIDYENASLTTKKINHIRGSPLYISPEMYLETKNGIQSDLWSLGVTMHTLLTGEHIIRETNDLRFIKKCANTSSIDKNPNISKKIKEIVRDLLIVDPCKRITISKIISMLTF